MVFHSVPAARGHWKRLLVEGRRAEPAAGLSGAEFTEFLSQIGFLYKWAPAPCSPVSELLGYSQRGSSLLLLWIQKGRALVDLAEKTV